MPPVDTVHLVVNPAAGDRTAQEFVQKYVEPLLASAGYVTATHLTESEGHAAQIAREISRDSSGTSPLSNDVKIKRTIILAGGDGTAHEFIVGIYSLVGGEMAETTWDIILIPAGTANALYASTYPPGTPLPTFSDELYEHTRCYDDDTISKLHSIAAFLHSKTTATRLPISLLSIYSPQSSLVDKPITFPSHVVISTCLHSNLLATAESLRSDYPGVERFKVAAQQNAGKFYSAQVTLYPTSQGSVEVYDPSSSTYLPSDIHASKTGTPDGTVEILDDFAYFLSSATCSRLEPTFVISPLISRIPQEGSMDVMVLRPTADPRVRSVLERKGYDSIRAAREAGDKETLEAVSEAWVPRAWEVLGKAYQDGAHVDLTYTPDGEVESNGAGTRVVEAYRCGGFSWKPTDPSDKDTHLVCADGSLMHIPPGGNASVRLANTAPGEGEPRIFLWA